MSVMHGSWWSSTSLAVCIQSICLYFLVTSHTWATLPRAIMICDMLALIGGYRSTMSVRMAAQSFHRVYSSLFVTVCRADPIASKDHVACHATGGSSCSLKRSYRITQWHYYASCRRVRRLPRMLRKRMRRARHWKRRLRRKLWRRCGSRRKPPRTASPAKR